MTAKINKSKQGKKRLQIGLATLQILVVLAIAISINKVQNNKHHPAAAESISTPSYSVKINGVTNYPTNISTQLHRVSVVVSIFNSGANPISISPGLQMILTDNTGADHPMTANYVTPGKVIGGTLNPGSTWSSPIDFDLSANENPSSFIYSVSNNSIPIKLGVPQ